MKNTLTGNKYKMDVGNLKVELFFVTDDSMVFTILEGSEIAKPGYSERVQTIVSEIRPRVYMVSWKEASGATVTHLEDHENQIVYSNATLPDGSFYNMKGIISPVQEL